VGLGGIAGSLLRYFLSAIAGHFGGEEFPIGTLLINLSGALLLGWVSNQLVISKKLPPYLLTALTTGVIGSYTTFSTFCYETVHLFDTGEFLYGFLYLFVSLFGGLLFVSAGMHLSKLGKKSRRTL
jgi:fluoride exporter